MASAERARSMEVLHEIRGGWPRDVLTWVHAIPPLLYLGAVAAGFAGFTTFVLTLLVTSSTTLAWVIGGLAAIFTWVWWAREHFGVNRESVTFYSDRLEANLESRVNGEAKSTSAIRHSIRYEQIGTLALVPKESTILIRFGLPCPGKRSALQVRPAKLSTRDLFDEIQQWMDDAAPDHLCRIVSGNEPEYSREFEIDTIFPDAVDLEGTGTLDLIGTNSPLRFKDREYDVRFDGYGKLTITPADADRPLLAALCDYTATAGPYVQVLAGHGLVVAEYRFSSHSRTTAIKFGWGETCSWSIDRGEVRRGDAPVGRLIAAGDGAKLQIGTALPEVIALSLMTVVCYFPFVYSMWHGGRADLPR